MNKISSREIFTIVFYLSCALFVGFGNTYLIKMSDTTSIISSIVGAIIGIIPLSLVLYISKHATDKNIFELLNDQYGIWGKILSILLVTTILIIGLDSIWNSLNFTVSQFLSKTPYLLVGIVFYIILTTAAFKGIEVISRCSLILFPVFITITILIWIGVIPHSDINNIYPILNISPKRFLTSAIMFPTYSILPLTLLLCIKRNQIVDVNKYNKSIILSYSLSCIFVIAFLFLIISCFGSDLAQIYAYPEYTLFKKIEALNFIQKVENIASIIIYIAFFILNSLGVYFVNCYIKSALKKKKPQTINIIILIIQTAICVGTIYIFSNYHPNFLISKYYICIIPLIIVLIMIAITLRINKKD